MLPGQIQEIDIMFLHIPIEIATCMILLKNYPGCGFRL